MQNRSSNSAFNILHSSFFQSPGPGGLATCDEAARRGTLERLRRPPTELRPEIGDIAYPRIEAVAMLSIRLRRRVQGFGND